MPIKELSSQLLSAGVPLSNKAFQEILNETSTDETGEVNLKQILETFNTSKPVSEFKDIHTALHTVSSMNWNRIQAKDLKAALDELSVSVKPEEHQMLEKTLDVDEKGHVSLKSALLALKSSKRFQDFKEVNKLANALDKVTNEKVDIDDIQPILSGLGVYFPEEELQQMLSSVSVDNEGKVDLKDFLIRLSQTPYFTKGSKLEGPMKALASIRKNMANPDDLGSMMKNIGVPLPQDVIQSALKNVTIMDDGMVNLEEFMGNLVNSGFSSPPETDEKINQLKLMDTVNTLKEGKVNTPKLSNVLEKMEVELTNKEFQNPSEHLPVDTERKINQMSPTDTMEALKGEMVDIRDLDSILGNMHIELTKEELGELRRNLPINAQGKTDLKTLMDTVQVITGGEVDLSDLDNVMQNMGIEPTPKEHLELVNLLPVYATSDGKIYKNRLLNCVKATKGLQVDVQDLDAILGNMAVKLTTDEPTDLTPYIPVDGEVVNDMKKVPGNMGVELKEKKHELVNNVPINGGKFKANNLDTILEHPGIELTEEEHEDVKEHMPLSGGVVDVSKLDTVLQNMGMKLIGTESKELLENLPVDAIGQVFQNRVLDEVKSLKGGMINVNDLNNVLGNMGIKLTEKEHEDLIANLPVDANGKIVLNKLMDGVKTVTGEDIDISDTEGVLENMRIQFSDKERLELLKKLSADGGKNDVCKLDTVLENMGMNLTEKELKDLTQSLQTDVDGKVDMKKVMDEVKAFTGENMNNMENVLSDTGIELPETEYAKLMKALPVSGDGKVHKNRTLKGVTSFRRGKVDISNLRPLLEKMNIKLTEKEFEQLNENLPVDAYGKIDLAKVMDGVKALADDNKVFQNRLLEAVKSLKGKKVSVNSLSTILDNMGIKLTDEELKDLTQNLPVDEAGKIHINNLDNTLERFGIDLTEEELAKLSEDLQIDPNGKVDLKEVMDGVKATTGGEVDVRDVKTTLKYMGIELTDKEYLKLLKNLPFNDDNKVFKNRLLKGVKSFKGGKVNIKNLDTILNNLEIKLVDSELKDLTQNIHADVDKKISLETLMDKVTDFTGEKIESKDVKNVVKNLGIELASEELEKLMKTLPTDAAGKLYHNRLMKSVKSLKKGKIKKNNLHKALENMGVKLTEEEFAKLSKKLQVDANGNVDLHNLMEEVKVITGSVDIKNLETVLGNMGIKITDEELKDLTQNLPVSVDNKVSLKTLKDEVKAFTGEKIDSSNLQNVLKDMGIELTDKELEQLMKTLPTDAHGKVFQNRLLKDLRSNKRGKVHVSNLDTVLEAMEVNLTEEELDHLKDPLNAYKKVDLKKVMDRIEDITGEEVDVNDMETVLGNMGIELTDKELSGLMNNLPVDKGKVYQKRLLNGIKFLKGGKIDSSKVYTILENMDMNLTEKELKDLIQNLPVDVNGKVDLEKVMNEVKPFSGDRVDTSKLENVLGNLGIKLTSNERLNLLETLPVNADGKVYQKRLMKGIKSLKRGNIDVNKLDTFLESMGIKITEEEFMDLIEKLPYDDEEDIKVDTVMKELSTVLGKQINVSDLKNALKDMKVEVTDKEYLNLVKTLPVDVEGKVFQKRLLDSVKNLKRGKIDMTNLVTFLENMGIELSHKELEDFSQNLPVDVDGKVDLKNVTLSMKDFTGEKINASDLKNVLGDMGIEVNDKECLELLKLLPIDGDKKVFQNRLLAALKSFKGGKVDVNNLNPVLGSMGIKLRNKELKSVVEKQPIDADGNVPLKKVMSDIKAVTGKLKVIRLKS
ncbi:uncharacterized protein [Bos indicus]|uniref:Uncharacterized protein isoform X4 n=1 Tax=Bos indicus TaxID=9915 RepID=A0ABM4R2M0_BOSIN